jgi:DmsE family decaheme c-type cytochrome
MRVMQRSIHRLGQRVLIAAAFLLWVVAVLGIGVRAAPAVSQAPGTAATAAPKTAPAKTTQPPATVVGEDTCLTCHDEQKKGYHGSKHSRKDDPRTPAAKDGCESCHGPGSRHIEDPAANPVRRFNKVPAAEVNATCTTCHNRGDHALWDGSQHERRNLSCVTCHSVHSFKSEAAQLKAQNQLTLCATCHRDKIAKLDRSGHMPVREGKMQCTTCHNPHGSTNVRLLRKGDSIAELCTSCHADKRGPYLWEHAPSRDGCTTCHDPHGSSNDRMLVAKPPLLCQRCHIATRHPSTIYDAALIGAGSSPSIRIYARSCVACHSAIHGSNHPSGQRFIR